MAALVKEVSGSTAEIARVLVNQALARGGQDNVTVAVLVQS